MKRLWNGHSNLVVQKLASRSVSFGLIPYFESMLSQNGTTILKFYLHISPEEQLSRFKQRLDDPSRQWKISESDYTERELWPKYVEAYEDAMAATSTKHAPWYVIPSNHKWSQSRAISPRWRGFSFPVISAKYWARKARSNSR